MVWIVIGQRQKTERIPGGACVEQRCPSCDELATFHERRAVRTFRLYFIDVFDYDAQRVMACGECGTLFATDEHGAPSEDTAASWSAALSSAAARVTSAGEAFAPMLERAGATVGPLAKRAADTVRGRLGEAGEGVGPLAERAVANVKELVGEAGDALGALVGSERRPARAPAEREDEGEPARGGSESERETDPEKRALLKRFEELERRLARERDE